MNGSTHIFGTDGIRATVGEYPMNADFIVKIGWAIGKSLTSDKQRKVIIGKDTRISGYMIESALQAGLSAAGINIHLLGPLPTPAVAYLTGTLNAQVGIVISASHNPYNDNGIKLFTMQGFKIPDEMVQTIEHWLTQPMVTADSKKLGKAWRVDDARGRYIEFCKSAIPHNTSLEKLKIVLDCANGATYHVAPDVFSELGADIIPIHVTPNGTNINDDCGSNAPDDLQQQVIERKADLGIAFDGDGDRVIMIDHCGEILDGDELLYIIAKSLFESNHIHGGVVGTYMTNMGLELAIKQMGLDFLRVPVGDHHVIKALKEKNWQLGGESSGHIIYLNVTTTADGIIAALQVLLAMQLTGKSLHELKKGIVKFPQKLTNIKHNGIDLDLNCAEITQSIQAAENLLGKCGRVLVRRSGTEAIIRIMVEGENNDVVENASQLLARAIEKQIHKT